MRVEHSEHQFLLLCVQVVAAANMPGMTHISFRPGLPISKVTPQKITGIPVSRFLRPQGQLTPITITPLSSAPPMMPGDQPVSAVTALDVSVAQASQSSTLSQSANTSSFTAPEKKKIEHFLGEEKVVDNFLGEPPDKVSRPAPHPSTTAADSIFGQVPVAVTGTQSPMNKSPARDMGKVEEGRREDVTDGNDSAFDAIKSMEWSSEGIATLPGSNLKVGT
jgi:hypothetical protein